MSLFSLFKKVTPEEEEISRKEAEVAGLADGISILRQQLLDETAELKTFECEYAAHCAGDFRRLDRWELRREEQDWLNRHLHEKPADDLREWTSSHAEAERQKAFAGRWESLNREQSEAEQHEREEAKKAPELNETDKAAIKSLYRELAKRFHPDGVLDPEAKAKRAAIMAEINAAYAARDLAKLRRLALNPDIVEHSSESIGDRLIRLIREIAVLRQQEAELRTEIEALRDSPTGRLRRQLDERAGAGAGAGADRFAPVLESIRKQIEAAKKQWETLRAEETAFWKNCD